MLQKKDNVLFFRESMFRIAMLFFNYPNKVYHIRLIEKEVGLSTTAIVKSVEELHRLKIVKIDKTALTTNISADLGSEAYRYYKLVFNLHRFKEFVDTLISLFNPETIVLFGSFAKGEDVEESDIDILVITSNKGDSSDFEVKCGKRFNRKVNIHKLSSLDKSSPEFKNAVANGIVLHGYLKVI